MTCIRRSLLGVAAATWLLAGCTHMSTADPRAGAIADLGATGKLRAAINFGNPVLASRDANGEALGVSGTSRARPRATSACPSSS